MTDYCAVVCHLEGEALTVSAKTSPSMAMSVYLMFRKSLKLLLVILTR